MFGTTTNCVPWPRFTSKQRGFAGGASFDGSVELGDRSDRFTVHLDDDVALLETGSRRRRIRVDVGDDDALGPFGSLQLLAEFRRQGLDRQAFQRALFAAAGEIAFARRPCSRLRG